MYMSVHVQAHEYTHRHMYVCTYVCMCVQSYMYVGMCVCVRMSMLIRIPASCTCRKPLKTEIHLVAFLGSLPIQVMQDLLDRP